jgi:hypothetical protein
MAEVWRQDGFSFRIRSNDHTPSHVHVHKAEAVLLIYIGDQNTDPSFRKNYGMSKKDAKKAIRIVAKKKTFLLTRWREIHA